VPVLSEGDILAHPFTRHDGGFVSKGKVHPVLLEAVNRGMKLDVGRGSHFSYENAVAVMEAGIIPDTLGADLHGYNARAESAYNVNGQFRPDEEPDVVDDTVPFSPTFNLVHCMAEMMAIGIPLEHVVAMVTSNAAAMMGKSDTMGSLQTGRTADISVLKMTSGPYTSPDGDGRKFKGTRRFTPVVTMRKGKLYQPVSDLLPEWIRQAA